MPAARHQQLREEGTTSMDRKRRSQPMGGSRWVGGFGGLPQTSRATAPTRDRLARRYTARSDPRKWYKTIDHITPELRHEPKLLIPDIKANGDAITYDAGNFYPHHNLYYITSQQWNLRALQALLRSGIAHMIHLGEAGEKLPVSLLARIYGVREKAFSYG